MIGPLSYIGGKRVLSKEIIALFPKHTTYVEAFAGGAQVLFHKEPSKVVEKLVADAERICTYEAQRISLENEAAIIRLQAEGAIELSEEKRIADRLALAPPQGSRRRLFWRRVYYWVVVVVLAVTGFFSTMLSFAPFQLGWMSWLVSGGMAVLTPFLVDRLLENPGMEKVIKVLTGVAAVASLASMMLLALIRGDLLAQQIRESEASAVVIDGAPTQPASPNTFYDRATVLLCAALFLMAFATEAGSGLALHEAWRSISDDSEDWAGLQRQLISIRWRMAEIGSEITRLRNAPGIFVARFWRDFYRALLLNATRSAMTKLLMAFFVLSLLFGPRARAEDRLNLVIAIDLTRSVAATGPDGRSDFQKNVEGVTRLLTQVPAGSRLAIIGITDHSFAEPYILMSARVPDEPGYFGERLNAAHRQIVRVRSERAARLTPNFKQTDIFGALELASQLFAQQPDLGRKELIVFSDMRESTPCLDFERAKLVPAFQAIGNKCGEVPSLKNVNVYVTGADGAGKSMAYWQSLQTFWTGYFYSTGAIPEGFTVLREIERFP
jgi:hypothetical protein